MDVTDLLLDESNLDLNWGITVTVAYLLSFVLSFNPLGLSYPVEYQIVALWFVAVSLPVGVTVKEMVDSRFVKINIAWAALILAGLLGNIYGILYLVDEQILFITYYQKWFLLPAALFAYTAYRMDGYSRKVYGASAVLNLVYGMGLFVAPVLAVPAFLVAAAIQGVPMLLDWRHYREQG